MRLLQCDSLAGGEMSYVAAGSPRSEYSRRPRQKSARRLLTAARRPLCRIPLVPQVAEASSVSGEGDPAPSSAREQERSVCGHCIYRTAQHGSTPIATRSSSLRGRLGKIFNPNFCRSNKACSHVSGSFFLLTPHQLQAESCSPRTRLSLYREEPEAVELPALASYP